MGVINIGDLIPKLLLGGLINNDYNNEEVSCLKVTSRLMMVETICDYLDNWWDLFNLFDVYFVQLQLLEMMLIAGIKFGWLHLPSQFEHQIRSSSS